MDTRLEYILKLIIEKLLQYDFVIHTVIILILLFFLGSVICISYVFIYIINESKSIKIYLIEFYHSLINPIIDYSYKIFILIKNIFYIPLGVDYRVFKKEFFIIKNINNSAEYELVTNLYPIAPKSNYKLLCFTVICIAFYIFWATKNIIETLYSACGNDLFVRSFPFIIAFVVYLLDVWIIRSYSISFKKKPFKTFLLLLFRLTVSLCVATLASFHILTVYFNGEIVENGKKIRKERIDAQIMRHNERIAYSNEYKLLASYRDQLLKAEYDFAYELHCLEYLKKGKKNNEEIESFKVDKFDSIINKYYLPYENDPNIYTKFKSIVEIKEKSEKIKTEKENLKCQGIVLGEEPYCKSGIADKNCPNLFERAKNCYINYYNTFGLSKSKSVYLYGIQGNSEIINLPNNDNSVIYFKFNELKEKLFERVGISDDETGEIGIKTALDEIKKQLAGAGYFGAFIIIAPAIILFLFELTVVFTKFIWGYTPLDKYMSDLNEETLFNLNNNGMYQPFITNKILTSYFYCSSEFCFEDHVVNITNSIKRMIYPLLKSRFFSAIIYFILIAIVYNIIKSQLNPWYINCFESFFNEFFNIIYDYMVKHR